MSGGITVKEFKHIPGVNDAEYIKKLEELHEIDKRIISKAVAKIKMLSAQSEHKTGHWIPVTNGRGGHQCDRCGSYAPSYQSGAEWLSNFCPECNADMRGEQ